MVFDLVFALESEEKRRVARTGVRITIARFHEETSYASQSGQARTRILTVRMSEADHGRPVERAKRARARTPSAYIRAAALTGQEFELPCWDTLREMRNECIRLTGATNNSPPGSVRDRALEAAINALDRISRF